MTRVFVDTNVLVYLFDRRERRKRRLAEERLDRETSEDNELVISTQVLQELYSALTKGKSPIATAEVAEGAVREAARLSVVQVDVPMVLQAVARSRQHSVSFWDSLILEAATVAGCSSLLSEDLSDGQRWGALTVVNPFG